MCDEANGTGCCGHVGDHGGPHARGGRAASEPCGCGGHFPRHFVLPATMTLLSREPSHGYSLFHKLVEMGLLEEGAGPAPVYRVLNRLEAEGLAVHEHVAEGQGPARKVYRLTEAGEQALRNWSERLARTRRLLDWFESGLGDARG